MGHGMGHGMAWDGEDGWGRNLTYSTLEHRRVRPPCWDCRVEARSTLEKGRAKRPPNFQSVGWMQPLTIATPEWTGQPGQPCTAEPLRRTGLMVPLIPSCLCLLGPVGPWLGWACLARMAMYDDVVRTSVNAKVRGPSAVLTHGLVTRAAGQGNRQLLLEGPPACLEVRGRRRRRRH